MALSECENAIFTMRFNLKRSAFSYVLHSVSVIFVLLLKRDTLSCKPEKHPGYGVMMKRWKSEHLTDTADAGHEGVDFFAGVVEGEGGAYGAGDAKALHKGMGAMVTGADGYAEAVE